MPTTKTLPAPLQNKNWFLELAAIGLGFLLLHLWLTWQVYQAGTLTPQVGIAGSHLGYDNFYRFWGSVSVLDISHPFFAPLGLFNRLMLRIGLSLATVVWLNLFLMNALIVGGHLFLYSALRHRLGLSWRYAFLSLWVVGSSFTTLVLSFTIESYPFSYFLLCWSILLLLSSSSRREASRNRWLYFVIGGVTITNWAKPILAELVLSTKPLYKRIALVWERTWPFLLGLVIVVGLYASIALYTHRPQHLPWQVAKEQTWIYSRSLPNQIPSFFLHATTPPSLQKITLGPKQENTWRPSSYRHQPLRLVIGLFWVGCLFGAIFFSNHNKARGLIGSFLAIDLLIHFVGGYGLDETVIFGGHWVMLLSLSVGLLLQQLQRSRHTLLLHGFTALCLLMATAQWLLNTQTILLSLAVA